jgi:hypothetical protein
VGQVHDHGLAEHGPLQRTRQGRLGLPQDQDQDKDQHRQWSLLSTEAPRTSGHEQKVRAKP